MSVLSEASVAGAVCVSTPKERYVRLLYAMNQLYLLPCLHWSLTSVCFVCSCQPSRFQHQGRGEGSWLTEGFVASF